MALTPIDALIPVAGMVFKAFVRGGRRLRILFVIAAASITIAIIAAVLAELLQFENFRLRIIAGVFGVIGGVLVLSIAAYQSVVEETARESVVQEVVTRVREHPDEPQAAWELAIIKLETYLNRKLATNQLDIFPDSTHHGCRVRHRGIWSR